MMSAGYINGLCSVSSADDKGILRTKANKDNKLSPKKTKTNMQSCISLSLYFKIELLV